MIRYLEISGRQSGKTERLIEGVTRKINEFSGSNQKVGICIPSANMKRNVRRRIGAHLDSHIHYIYSPLDLCAQSINNIFFDEFDYININYMNEFLEPYYLNSINYYFFTTPKRIRNRYEINNAPDDADPLIDVFRLNNQNYVNNISNLPLNRNTFSDFSDFRREYYGQFINEEVAMPIIPPATRENIERATLIPTVSLANVETLISGVIAGVDWIPIQGESIGSDDAIRRMVELEVEKRMSEIKKIKTIELSPQSEIGKSVGNRIIEI